MREKSWVRLCSRSLRKMDNVKVCAKVKSCVLLLRLKIYNYYHFGVINKCYNIIYITNFTRAEMHICAQLVTV
jgi:hypothetical protein